MTLRFIVGRILRELIELAERDTDAELVDALHDASGTPWRAMLASASSLRTGGPSHAAREGREGSAAASLGFTFPMVPGRVPATRRYRVFFRTNRVGTLASSGGGRRAGATSVTTGASASRRSLQRHAEDLRIEVEQNRLPKDSGSAMRT